MFYLYFSLFNKNIHEVKNIAIRIVSCHTYRDTYRIVKMCIVTSLVSIDSRLSEYSNNRYSPNNDVGGPIFSFTGACTKSGHVLESTLSGDETLWKPSSSH